MENKYILLCVLLSAALIQGLTLPRGDRCLCRQLSKKINVKAIAKLEVFPISATCEKLEIIVTMKGSKKTKCLNPKVKVIQDLISAQTNRKKVIQKVSLV